MGRARNTSLSAGLASAGQRPHDHRFDAIFGARHTTSGPDAARDAIGTVRSRNRLRLLELFEPDPSVRLSDEHRFVTGICALNFKGQPFMALDRSYRTLSALRDDIIGRIEDENDPNPPPTFLIDMDAEDAPIEIFGGWLHLDSSTEESELHLSDELTATALLSAQETISGL